VILRKENGVMAVFLKKPMLRQRIITVMWLLPLALLCILIPARGAYYPVWLSVQILVLALFVWGGVEWTHLMRFKPLISRLFIVGLAAVLSLLAVFFNKIPPMLVWTVALLWWSIALYAVVRYQQMPFHRFGGTASAIGMGACLLVLPYFSFLYLKTVTLGHNWLLYAVLAVWCADTGAYFVGKKCGRRKLADQISPGKTKEGLMGAMVSVWVMATLIYLSQGFEGFSFVQWMIWMTVIALASVVGDLLESLFKRMQGVKDSGTALPGHGGILDRIDSLTAALPIAAMMQWIMLSK
jgi:phosphatidate cytidylyltransferase